MESISSIRESIKDVLKSNLHESQTLEVLGIRRKGGGRRVGHVPISTSNDCLDLGNDLDSPVSLDYYDQAPSAFNDTIGTTKSRIRRNKYLTGGNRGNREFRTQPLLRYLCSLLLILFVTPRCTHCLKKHPA